MPAGKSVVAGVCIGAGALAGIAGYVEAHHEIAPIYRQIDAVSDPINSIYAATPQNSYNLTIQAGPEGPAVGAGQLITSPRDKHGNLIPQLIYLKSEEDALNSQLDTPDAIGLRPEEFRNLAYSLAALGGVAALVTIAGIPYIGGSTFKPDPNRHHTWNPQGHGGDNGGHAAGTHVQKSDPTKPPKRDVRKVRVWEDPGVRVAGNPAGVNVGLHPKYNPGHDDRRSTAYSARGAAKVPTPDPRIRRYGSPPPQNQP